MSHSPLPVREAAPGKFVSPVILQLVLLTGLGAVPLRADEQPIDFARDIRPILSNSCFECHGPDAEHREADLRLDQPEGLYAPRDSGTVLVPRAAEESELWKRVTSTDPDVRMPPPESGHPLEAEQRDKIRKWIEQGATWSRHWAFVPPERPAIPPVRNHDWVTNPIDAFVLARLEREGLEPAPRASPLVLLRRLSLDLTGLPPTPSQIQAASDQVLSPKEPWLAHEAQVGRLLGSPHYGERWGRVWLDAARYADSDGFEKDKPRSVYFYRDYVVNALNDDMPYDRFIMEQIAGDLFPKPTQDQIVATGFLRNSMINEEGGVDPEQFRMEAMFDRMNAIGKAVLGLTIQCAQCHAHKYDPLTQAEYYRLFAFINNSYEASHPVYAPGDLEKRHEILARIDQIESRLRADDPDWRTRFERWVEQRRAAEPEWTALPLQHEGDNAQRYLPQDDGSLLAQGYAPTRFDAVFSSSSDAAEIRSFRLDVLTDPNLPAGGPGRAADGMFALTEFKVQATSLRDPSQSRWVKFQRVASDYSNPRTQLDSQYADRDGKTRVTGPVAYAIDDQEETAWGADAGPGRRNQDRVAVFVADQNVAFEGGTRLKFHLVQKHGGWNSDDNQNLNLGRFRIALSSTAPPVDQVPLGDRLRTALFEQDRTEDEDAGLFDRFAETVESWREAREAIEQLWSQHPESTTQLVLKERARRRPTHRLDRGDFLAPREEVTPGVPSLLHPLAESDASSLDAALLESDPPRLQFAKWLVDRRSPTTARAIVNRVWQEYFGTGLVSTSEDLGSQSEPPSHPELLDWLAVEFMESGWSLKRLHYLVTTSSTYCQSSAVTPELYERDPHNRLLARGPRFRVPAETVRDIALAASGLLTRELGGPSVYPPAPQFLFEPPASYGPKQWPYDTGSDKYRRALYTFRFRSVPYPALEVFGAPNGDASCVRRPSSNTPLQALTTLNEPLFMECARSLAGLTMQAASTDEARIEYAFQRCLSRPPDPRERSVLLDLLAKQRTRLERGELDAKLVASSVESESVGEARPVELAADELAADELAADELAAWTILCRVLLNLDETITKQ